MNTDQEERKYDEAGNLIYSCDSNGVEVWYDEAGNRTHYRNSEGYEEWYDRNEAGSILFRNSEGFEVWYDEHGNRIHSRDANGCKWWHDEHGNRTHYRDPTGFEEWYDYDAAGNRTHSRDSDGNEAWYDSHGNRIHSRDSDGNEAWYDDHGNRTHFRNPNDDKERLMHIVHVTLNQKDYPECPLCNDLNMCGGVEKSEINACPILSEDGGTWDVPEWCPLRNGGVHVKLQDDTEPQTLSEDTAPASVEYDYCTHYRNSSGVEKWREYDKEGNCTYSRNSDGCEQWFEHNEAGEMKKQPVKTIETSNAEEFERECARLYNDGYRLQAASVNMVNSEAYDFCSSYMAVWAHKNVCAKD